MQLLLVQYLVNIVMPCSFNNIQGDFSVLFLDVLSYLIEEKVLQCLRFSCISYVT